MATNGLLPRINSLFNNSLYSDVKFVFMNENGTSEEMYCHKLILAMQSKVFAHLFYEKTQPPNEVNIQASKKQLFYLLFKFLYTGDIQFCTFNEAQDLYELASDYLVEELTKKCHDYMLQGSLTVDNVFSRYEHALKKDLEVLLKDCRSFVCTNAEMVLKSDQFTKAPPEVVEDIVKLDNLPLLTELNIIKAVLNWGSESLKSNEITYNEKNLRKSIEPFLRHLRILTLTSAEFQYLVEHYNVFTPVESMVLIQKIIMPDSNNKVPENFCSLVSKRGTEDVSRNCSVDYQQSNHSVRSNSPKSVRSEPSKPRSSENNKIFFQVRKYPVKHTNAASSGFKQRNNSSPNIRDIQLPAPQFHQNLTRDFQFPLKNSEKSFKLSFRKDITSRVIIKMKSGNLSLYGFELKVRSKNDIKEEIEVSVSMQGFSKQFRVKSYNRPLYNDMLSIKFDKPMRLQEGYKGTLEVSIEDLLLERCCQISKKHYELNSGLDFNCEFCIDSNKKTESDENFLFLINKLIYVPC